MKRGIITGVSTNYLSDTATIHVTGDNGEYASFIIDTDYGLPKLMRSLGVHHVDDLDDHRIDYSTDSFDQLVAYEEVA